MLAAAALWCGGSLAAPVYAQPQQPASEAAAEPVSPMPPAAAAQAADVADVLAAIAAQPRTPRRFTQQTRSQWLDTPVEQSGFVSVEPDGTVMQVTREPEQQIVRIRADGLSLTRADGKQRELPADHPLVSGFLGGFRALLLGDQPALEAVYDAQVTGPLTQWTLDLTPRKAAMRKRIESLTVQGQRGVIDSVVIAETDGDTRSLAFSALDNAANAP